MLKKIDDIDEVEQLRATAIAELAEKLDEKFIALLGDKEPYSYSFKSDRRFFFYFCTTVKLWAFMFATEEGEEVTLGYAYEKTDMLQLIRSNVKDVEQTGNPLLKEMLQLLPALV